MSSDDESSASPPATPPTDADATGLVPRAVPRLSDFLSGEPSLPVAYLLVVTGEARGRTLVVDDLPAVIGRSDDADLTVADETVSRRHARLSGDRTSLVLGDLGSSNGTTLNGNAIVGELALHDGDLVGFGSATVVVKVVA